jgi:hypothetical protein
MINHTGFIVECCIYNVGNLKMQMNVIAIMQNLRILTNFKNVKHKRIILRNKPTTCQFYKFQTIVSL